MPNIIPIPIPICWPLHSIMYQLVHCGMYCNPLHCMDLYMPMPPDMLMEGLMCSIETVMVSAHVSFASISPRVGVVSIWILSQPCVLTQEFRHFVYYDCIVGKGGCVAGGA